MSTSTSYTDTADIIVNVTMTSNGFEETAKKVKDLDEKVKGTSINTRVMGRDLMSLAFGFNFLARHMNYVNPIMDQFLTALMAVGVTMRSLDIITKLTSAITGFSGSVSLASVAQKIWNATLMEGAFWMGILTAGAAVVLGLSIWAATLPMQPKVPSMQTGGEVKETGLFMLHKGETVVPAGSNYSWVNINMQTGPISNSVDVDNMLNKMALTMAIESRRRGM